MTAVSLLASTGADRRTGRRSPRFHRPGAVRTSKATFELYRDRSGEHPWRLVRDNGNVIADGGEGCRSTEKARKGLESVRSNAPDAPVVDAEG